MKFAVSSSELLQGLLSVSRVVSSKNSLPILDNFLFVLKGEKLEVTASDLEITLKTAIKVDEVYEEGEIAVPAKLLTDSLKEFPNLPLVFSTKKGEEFIEISWASGAAQIPYFPAEDYPALISLNEIAISVEMPAEALLEGINNTLYAAADEELRVSMNGIFLDIEPEFTTFVATDAHKLVCYKRKDIKSQEKTSFPLPKKTSNILKSILAKVEDIVTVKFDSKNAIFSFGDTLMICRLIEAKFPAYKSVIPTSNPNKLIISRIELLNAAKRVAVCSNQATAHIKLELVNNELMLSAQDLSFSISAYERVKCQYDGDELSIGFKSPYLIEILSNLTTEEVMFELADGSRAALILPVDEQDENIETKALLMPILI